MPRKLVVVVMLLAIIATIPACSSWSREGKGAGYGALGGAGLGALIGAATGSWAWGAVIGAAGGALAGYVIAKETAPDDTSAPPPPNYSAADASRRAEADNYFRMAMNAKSTSESEYYLRKSIDTYPTAAAYNNLGLVYLQGGNRSGAEQAWNDALRVDPNYQPARDNLNRVRAS